MGLLLISFLIKEKFSPLKTILTYSFGFSLIGKARSNIIAKIDATRIN